MTAPHGLPFRHLVLLDDPLPRLAAMNMAIDEVLLAGLESHPLLRLYRWIRPSVSIGCFDPMDPVARKWPRHDRVRRWTGGGVVEHGSDLTFSLLVPRPLLLASLPASESYRVIHGVLAVALSQTGIIAGTHATASPMEHERGRPCFENAVPFDLLVADRKVAGGAQRRTRRGLLHQGSVQGRGLDPSELASLGNVLPHYFGQRLERRRLSIDEINAAERLVNTKYGAEAWLHRF